MVYVSLEIKNQVNESSGGIPLIGKTLTKFKKSKFHTKYLTQQDDLILEIKKKALEKNQTFEKWINSRLSDRQFKEMKNDVEYSETIRELKGFKIP